MKLLALLILFSIQFAYADCKLNTLTFNEKTGEGFICTLYKDAFGYKKFTEDFCAQYQSHTDLPKVSDGGYTFNCYLAMMQVQDPNEKIIKAAPNLQKSNNNLPKYSESLDKKTGKGSFIVSVDKNCDTNVQEFDKYKLKSKLLCEKNDFVLIDFDSSFLNSGCSVEYSFKCDITLPEKKAIEAKLKSESVNKAKDKCSSLGFEKDSNKFRNCVLELIK